MANTNPTPPTDAAKSLAALVEAIYEAYPTLDEPEWQDVTSDRVRDFMRVVITAWTQATTAYIAELWHTQAAPVLTAFADELAKAVRHGAAKHL